MLGARLTPSLASEVTACGSAPRHPSRHTSHAAPTMPESQQQSDPDRLSAARLRVLGALALLRLRRARGVELLGGRVRLPRGARSGRALRTAAQATLSGQAARMHRLEAGCAYHV